MLPLFRRLLHIDNKRISHIDIHVHGSSTLAGVKDDRATVNIMQITPDVRCSQAVGGFISCWCSHWHPKIDVNLSFQS